VNDHAEGKPVHSKWSAFALGVRMWLDIGRAWRVVAGAVVIQLLGGFVGLLLHPFHDAWENEWLGGALATPVGFLVGLWWQLSHSERRRTTPISAVVFLGVLAFALGALALLWELPQLQDEARRIRTLSSLPEGSLSRITFFDKYGEDLLLTITDEEALRGFVLACRDVEGYSPNHPRYEQSWYVILDGAQSIELECHYEDRWPEKVVGYFVAKSGNSTRYYGSFISETLRAWFRKYVQGTSPDADG
jgi:hypothetical protein